MPEQDEDELRKGYRETMMNTQTTTKANHYFGALVLMATFALAASLLLTQAERPARAAFPGQNGKIAFVSDRDGNAEIYAMNPDGTGQINLTNLGSANDTDPDWGVSTADTSAPKVNKVAPTENATGVSPTANVSALFSEAMNPFSINTTTVRLRKAGTSTNLGATVTYDSATKKAILNPKSNLSLGATYEATVTTGTKDLAGNALDQNVSNTGNQPKLWRFTIKK
jgi:Bacterial Ig-like domain